MILKQRIQHLQPELEKLKLSQCKSDESRWFLTGQYNNFRMHVSEEKICIYLTDEREEGISAEIVITMADFTPEHVITGINQLLSHGQFHYYVTEEDKYIYPNHEALIQQLREESTSIFIDLMVSEQEQKADKFMNTELIENEKLQEENRLSNIDISNNIGEFYYTLSVLLAEPDPECGALSNYIDYLRSNDEVCIHISAILESASTIAYSQAGNKKPLMCQLLPDTYDKEQWRSRKLITDIFRTQPKTTVDLKGLISFWEIENPKYM